MSDTTDFKEAVTAYIEMHDEITRASKQLRELKAKKDAIGEIVLKHMKDRGIDECDSADGKIVRKTSKRTEGLKQEMVFEELKSLAGGDEALASASLQNIINRRNVIEKEIISCAKST
jgi:hypothetical protein